MNLVFLIHSLGGGGAERVTATLANYWAKERDWTITVITLDSGECDSYLLGPKVRRIALDLATESDGLLSALWNNCRRVWVIRRVLTRQKPDVAVAMMTTANILLAMASFGVRSLRRIGSERVHPPMVKLGTMWDRLREYAYQYLDGVVPLTRETANWLLENTEAKHVRVIPNPVVWPLTRNMPIVSPSSVGSSKRKRVLGVGRLSPQKGFDLLIDVFAALRPSYPEWELVILGEGSLGAQLIGKVEMLRLSDVIFFPGRVGNVADWYDHADLYVMPSQFEGFPNTLVEAMASGLPAVSFDCDTGPRDIIRHQVDGLLVPAGDVVALTAALAKLMGDASERQRLALRAIEVRERFAIEKVANQWEALIEELA